MADEHDPKVSQRYRQLPGGEPSRELDHAILAAAHRSIDKPHAPLVVPAGRHRWYYSLAAAAVLVLAIAVTAQVERQRPDAELAPPPPAPAARPAPEAQTARLAAEKASAEEARERADAAARKESAASGMAASRPAPMSAPDARPISSPERELERIAGLRREGRDEEADKALAEFRMRYPDYRMSPEMRAKVERKAAPAR